MSSPVARRICVYCASSRACDPEYYRVAHELGRILAGRGYSIIYGGGAMGSMRALADGALAGGGTVTGIMPKFLMSLELGHPELTELRVVEDMRVRKHVMLSESDGVVALPGGSGTLEELFEAITLKRLGLYTHPIILVNTRAYFTTLVRFLEHVVAERFMDERHLQMWQIVDSPADVPAALDHAPPWSADAGRFATV